MELGWPRTHYRLLIFLVVSRAFKWPSHLPASLPSSWGSLPSVGITGLGLLPGSPFIIFRYMYLFIVSVVGRVGVEHMQAVALV